MRHTELPESPITGYEGQFPSGYSVELASHIFLVSLQKRAMRRIIHPPAYFFIACCLTDHRGNYAFNIGLNADSVIFPLYKVDLTMVLSLTELSL
jgi:hypothetical protein